MKNQRTGGEGSGDGTGGCETSPAAAGKQSEPVLSSEKSPQPGPQTHRVDGSNPTRASTLPIPLLVVNSNNIMFLYTLLFAKGLKLIKPLRDCGFASGSFDVKLTSFPTSFKLLKCFRKNVSKWIFFNNLEYNKMDVIQFVKGSKDNKL